MYVKKIGIECVLWYFFSHLTSNNTSIYNFEPYLTIRKEMKKQKMKNKSEKESLTFLKEKKTRKKNTKKNHKEVAAVTPVNDVNHNHEKEMATEYYNRIDRITKTIHIVQLSFFCYLYKSIVRLSASDSTHILLDKR